MSVEYCVPLLLFCELFLRTTDGRGIEHLTNKINVKTKQTKKQKQKHKKQTQKNTHTKQINKQKTTAKQTNRS